MDLPFRLKGLRTFACFPLSPTKRILLSTKKDRLEVGGKRLEKDAEVFLMVIANTFILSFALTYKDELTLMVGASLRLASRQESIL